MKIEFENRTWRLEVDDVLNREAEAIRAYTGMSIGKWLLSLGDEEKEGWVRSFDALYWLMRRQNGVEVGPICDVSYAPYRFAAAFLAAGEAEKAAAAPEEEPDPTQPPVASEPSPESSTPPKPKSSAPAAEATPHG